MPSRELIVATSIGTGLGLLGFPSITMGERARPSELTDVDDATWNWFAARRNRPATGAGAAEGYRLGVALLHAEGALRWRRPHRVARTVRSGGDADADATAADLAIDDHVLVRIRAYRGPVLSTRPARLFDRLLLAPPRATGAAAAPPQRTDWFDEAAPREYDAFLGAVRILGGLTPGRLDPALDPWARPLWLAVAHASADRWRASLSRTSDLEGAVLRLLGVGALPVCVTDRHGALHRLPSQWEWRQRFEVRRFSAFPVSAGAARVGFHVEVGERRGGDVVAVEGQVDVRWTNGWMAGTPTARLSLRTPWTALPGVRAIT